MIYALNLYDLIDGKEETYKQYVAKATRQLKGLNAQPVASGTDPIKQLKGNTRQHMLVMQFGSIEDFEEFMRRLDAHELHQLRESSTTHYIWTLYQNWDLRTWLNG